MKIALTLLAFACFMQVASAAFYYQYYCLTDRENFWNYAPWAKDTTTERITVLKTHVKNYQGFRRVEGVREDGNRQSDPNCDVYTYDYLVAWKTGYYPRLNYIDIIYDTSANYATGHTGVTFKGTNGCYVTPSDGWYCRLTYGEASATAQVTDFSYGSNISGTNIYYGGGYNYSGKVIDCDYFNTGDWTTWYKVMNYGSRKVFGSVMSRRDHAYCNGEVLDVEGYSYGTVSCSRDGDGPDTEEENLLSGGMDQTAGGFWHKLETKRGWNDPGGTDPAFTGTGGARS